MMASAPDRSGLNWLLAALPAEEYARLQAHLVPTPLGYKHVLYDVHQPIEHVYFVNAGVCSVLLVIEPSAIIEVAMVGREGMLLPPSFAGGQTANLKVVCQVPGMALRLPIDILRREQMTGGQFGALLEHYTQAIFLMMAQLSA